MGYFPTVNKGDKVQPTALFHNAVVRTVNAVRGDPQRGISPLSRTRTTLPVLATEDIPAWNPVELVGDDGFSFTTRAYLVRQARSKSAAIGIAREEISKDSVGSVTIFGLEIVEIPDNSTGDYVEMKDGGSGKLVFTRTEETTAYRVIDSIAETPSKQVAHILWKPFAETGDSSPWAFEATATPETDTGGTPTGKYTVFVRGGTAQPVGGNTAVFQNLEVEHVNDGEYFFIQFMLWDNDFEPTCYWYNDQTGQTGTIRHAQALPVSSDNSRFMTLVLCKVDASAPGAIVQYRAGAIDIHATLAAGVSGNGITVRNISAQGSSSGSGSGTPRQ